MSTSANVGAGTEGLPTQPDDPRLADWYHTIELGNGLVSQGYFDHRSVVERFGIPESLEGKTVLDVGTGDGFFAFEMEHRGAKRVVAIDVARLGDCDWLPRMTARLPDTLKADEHWPNHFKLAHAMRGSRVEYRTCSVYDLSPESVGTFDLVFCASLLLHLKNPLQALINIRSVTREMAVIESAVHPVLEESFPADPYVSFGALRNETEAGEDNTFWLMSTRALQRMLEYADFAHSEPQGVFDLPPAGPRVTSVVGYTTPLEDGERLRRELVRAQAELGYAQAEVARAQNEVQAIRDTMSWRVTSPLRWLRRRMDGA